MSSQSQTQCWKTAFPLPPNELYYETVPVPLPSQLPYHFLQGHLRSTPGLVEQYDLYRPLPHRGDKERQTQDEVMVAIIRIGNNLSGHPGKLHGGAAALLFDDVVGFAAHDLLSNRLVVTANLAVDFYLALPTNSTILIQVRRESLDGRKLWCVAQMTNLEQTLVFAQARVLYIIPRSKL